MPLPAPDVRSAEEGKERQSLSDWLDLASKWFQSELRRPVGSAARAYLERRGLKEAEWERFGIGYAPAGRTGLKDYLIAKGAKPADLVACGVLILPEDGGAPYDRFRDRVMFPIADARGRMVSFGGRALDPNARAKYLNGPETRIFQKGHLLYGLPEARKMMLAGGPASPLVVVEGYMDAIACQRAGIPAVAPLGTALTEEQMELLWRLHPEPTLSFDGDAAGQRAASRTIDRALPLVRPGKTLKFSVVSGGKDPDDVLREQGELALREQLEKTTSFGEALFARELQSESVLAPEGIAAIKGRLRAAASAIQDADLSEQYKRFLFEKFDERFPPNRRWRGGLAYEGAQYLVDKSAAETLRRRIRRFNATVAHGAVLSPQYLLDYTEEFSRWGFGDERLELLKEPFLECLLDYDGSPEILTRLIHKHEANMIVMRAAKVADEIDAPPFFDDRVKPSDRRILWQHCYEAIVELARIEEQLSDRRHSDLADGVDQAIQESYLLHRKSLIDQRRVISEKMHKLEWFYP